MLQSIRTHGDLLERGYADFIESRLQGYALFWSRAIGNDGSSRLLSPDAVSAETKERRERSAQDSYTILESLICAHRAVAQLEEIDWNAFDQTRGLDIHLASVNSFMVFYAHLGRARDCISRIGETWGMPGLEDDLVDLYRRRNVVLHGAKIPFLIIDAALAIVPPRGSAEDSREWGRGSRWTDADRMNCEDIVVHCKELLHDVTNLINDLYCRVIPAIPKELVTALEAANSNTLNYQAPGISSSIFVPSLHIPSGDIIVPGDPRGYP